MELDLGDLGAPGTPGSAPGSPAGPAPLIEPTLPAGDLQMLGVPQAVDDGEERVARRNNNVRRVAPMALTAVPAVAAGKPAPQAQHRVLAVSSWAEINQFIPLSVQGVATRRVPRTTR